MNKERYQHPQLRTTHSPAPWKWNPSPEILKKTKEEIKEDRAILGVELHENLCEHVFKPPNPKVKCDCRAPPPITSFAHMGLDLGIVSAVSPYEPTPFQAQAIPVVLKGFDLFGFRACGYSEFGAYLEFAACTIPLTQHCFAKTGNVALVLTPRKELANKMEEEVRMLSQSRPIDILKLVGDDIEGPQAEERIVAPQVIIASPWELGRKGNISISRVSFLVVLEAEHLIGLGCPQLLKEAITESVSNVMGRLLSKHQTLVFTNTMHVEVYDFVGKHLTKPVYVIPRDPVTSSEDDQITSSLKFPTTLLDMLKTKVFPLWDCGVLSAPYRQIICRLIDKIVAFEDNGDHFMFGVEELQICNEEWEVELMGARKVGYPGSCREAFKSVIAAMFRNEGLCMDVDDFQFHISEMKYNFKLLKYHPLVLSLDEMANFPIAGMHYLDKKDKNEWKCRYKQLWGDKILKDWPVFSSVEDEVDQIILDCYAKNKKGEYESCDSEAALRCTRNILRHFIDWEERSRHGTQDEYHQYPYHRLVHVRNTQVLPKLKFKFPRVWLQLFGFFISESINPRVEALMTLSDPELDDIVLRKWLWTTTEDNYYFEETVEGWLQKAISLEPLISWKSPKPVSAYWFELALSCYPSRRFRGTQQRPKLETLLLDLFRKHRGNTSGTSDADLSPVVKMLLSRLTVVSVRYCGKKFVEEDWKFVLNHLKRWIGPVMTERMAGNVTDTITGSSTSDNVDAILGNFIDITDLDPLKIAETALISISLSCTRFGCQQAEDADKIKQVKPVKYQILEAVVRLYLFTGIADAAAIYCSDRVVSDEFDHSYFWEVVMSSIVSSSTNDIERAVESAELWGFSKGPISSLYAILCSPTNDCLLQAAYFILSSEPVVRFAFVEQATVSKEDLSPLDSLTERSIHGMIGELPYEVLQMDLVTEKRVHVFLAWSLFLSLWSLPLSSLARKKLARYIDDSADSAILEFLFQDILKDIPEEFTTAANRAIKTGSLLFSVQNLWNFDPVKMASLSGAIFGLMLRILPVYVRQWFRKLCDRDPSASSGIESITIAWFRKTLIEHELSLVCVE